MERANKSILISAVLIILLAACAPMNEVALPEEMKLPDHFVNAADTAANLPTLEDLFADNKLRSLIDTALAGNYDLKAALQRIEIARANTRIADAARFPEISAVAGAAVDRFGDYTLNGVGNFDTNLSPNIDKDQRIPNPTGDFFLGLRSSWEIDIWGKLKDRKRSAYAQFLASQKGRQWLETQMVSEVARLYFELMSLDNQSKIISKNIELQKGGLEIVEAQMAGGRATALAVRQFKAQVLHTQGTAISIRQSIIETENELNRLIGRFPSNIDRDTSLLAKNVAVNINAGIPSTVLLKRPDIQEAELELLAAKADISAARKAFLPSLSLNPYIGFNAFKAPLLFSGGSLAVGAASSLAAPILNRGSIIGGFKIANAAQVNAFYNYQQTILDGFHEVVNNLNAIENLQKAYELKMAEVETLTQAVATANDLYLAGYASYLEVIMAQGSVLQAEIEQISIKKEIFNATINLYRSLGGRAG